MTHGITPTGFNRKTASEIKNELDQDYKTAYGQTFDTSNDSNIGIENSIWSERISQLWELAEAVYYSPFVQFAQGVSLDNSVSYLGITRLEAKKSKVTLTLSTTGSTAITVPSGSIVKQSSNNKNWITLSTVIIPPTSSITVDAESEEYGLITAPIGTVDTIVNSVLGWDGVTNLSSEIIGRNEETDDELRLRRYEALFVTKGGTLTAVINKVREVDGVIYVDGRENRTPTTDINGLPPNSINIIIDGGLDQDIANKIRISKGAGIETHGTITNTVIDEQGNTHTIKFDRVINKDIYMIVNITRDISKFPPNGISLVKILLEKYGLSLKNGDDVLNWRAIGILDAIDGIIDVNILQGVNPVPTLASNISISNIEKARIQQTNIVVNVI
jgi:uncharacterized phage protein gp47/JayE